jgi:hypothetical protein
MAWKNNKGDTSIYRPIRIRLDDNLTKTSDYFTDEELQEFGWYWEDDVGIIIPVSTSTQAGEIL